MDYEWMEWICGESGENWLAKVCKIEGLREKSTRTTTQKKCPKLILVNKNCQTIWRNFGENIMKEKNYLSKSVISVFV